MKSELLSLRRDADRLAQEGRRQLADDGLKALVQQLAPVGHLAVALGAEAIRAGRSVYFCPLADIIDSLAEANRERHLRERISYLCRTLLLIDPSRFPWTEYAKCSSCHSP